MNKNTVLILSIAIPLVFYVNAPEAANGAQSFKMGDPNCETSRSGGGGMGGGGSSWNGMPGPGKATPNSNILEQRPESMEGSGTGGMGMGNAPWSGMMGMGRPSSPAENSEDPRMGSMRMAGPGMGMPGMMPPPMGMMGQNQSGAENNPPPGMGPAAVNPGMAMGMNVPPGGPWGPYYGGGMMMNPGNVNPGALESRLDNIERRLDDLIRHIQNLSQK